MPYKNYSYIFNLTLNAAARAELKGHAYDSLSAGTIFLCGRMILRQSFNQDGMT